MGRKKVVNRNVTRSVSLPKYLSDWIDNRKDFNLSKFVKVMLLDYKQQTENSEC